MTFSPILQISFIQDTFCPVGEGEGGREREGGEREGGREGS